MKASELKAGDWFETTTRKGVRRGLCVESSDDWDEILAYLRGYSYELQRMCEESVTPLPQCTGWDWQPPTTKPYAVRQAEWVSANGIEVGSRVRVNQHGEGGPNWDATYARLYHDRQGAVKHICERWGVSVAFGETECVLFPFTVLEPVVENTDESDIAQLVALIGKHHRGDQEEFASAVRALHELVCEPPPKLVEFPLEPAATSSPNCIRADDGTYVWSPGSGERTYTADELRLIAEGVADMNREQAATQEQAVQVREPSYEWLLAYYESNEEFASKLGSAMDIFENHFDEQGKLLGNGKWRLDELGKALVMVREATQGFVNRMAPIATVPPPEQPGDVHETAFVDTAPLMIEPDRAEVQAELACPNVDVDYGYRRLQIGETVLATDEFTYDFDDRPEKPSWRPVSALWVGKNIDDRFVPVRRRVKPQPEPEPTYRPFRSAEEFKPHRDRWIVSKAGNMEFQVIAHGPYGVSLSSFPNPVPWKELIDDFTFDDGQPCGVRCDQARDGM